MQIKCNKVKITVRYLVILLNVRVLKTWEIMQINCNKIKTTVRLVYIHSYSIKHNSLENTCLNKRKHLTISNQIREIRRSLPIFTIQRMLKS